MFVLLLQTSHGWTDHLGAVASTNRWPSTLEAMAAAFELDKAWGTSSHWRVVHVDDLHQHELIA